MSGFLKSVLDQPVTNFSKQVDRKQRHYLLRAKSRLALTDLLAKTVSLNPLGPKRQGEVTLMRRSISPPTNAVHPKSGSRKVSAASNGLAAGSANALACRAC